jgi:hypothetical protein
MKTTEPAIPIVDEVIAEVRRHKRAIMAEHGDDVESLLRNLQDRQKGNPGLVTSTPPASDDKSGSSRDDTP